MGYLVCHEMNFLVAVLPFTYIMYTAVLVHSVPILIVALIINILHHMIIPSDVTSEISVALHSTSCGSFCSLNLVYSFVLCNKILVSNCCLF